MKPRILAVTSAALLVAACSSSKKSSSHVAAHDVSYSGPTTPVAITTVDDAVGAVSSTTAGAQTVSGKLGDFTAVAGVSAAPDVSVQDAVRLAARWLAKAGAAQVTGVAFSDSGSCEIRGSGSMRADVTDPNHPGTHSGDWGEFTFTNCEDEPGKIVDGVVRLTIVSTDGVNFVKALDDSRGSLTPGFAYSASVAFTDLTFTNGSGVWSGMDGTLTLGVTRRVSPDEIERAIVGTGLVFGVGQGTHLLDATLLTGPTGTDAYRDTIVGEYGSGVSYDVTATRETLNGKVCSVAMGGCVQLVTNTAVRDVRGDAHPSSGSFTITAGNAMIRLDIVNATSVDVTFDLNTADATPAVGPFRQTWACLDANTCTWAN